LIGHGSRDPDGKEGFLQLAAAYQAFTPHREVIPCFLELTAPTIADGVEDCVQRGYRDIVALPVLLLGARHNKFDVTLELDRLQRQRPELVFHYGGPLGIQIEILDWLQQQLTDLEARQSAEIPRCETVVLFVGRGSSDPEANAEAYKLARLIWEGSGYCSVEVCFIGITHPRLEVGFERALLLQPRRIIVLPYFLFTGVLVKKIQAATASQHQIHPQLEWLCLPEMGIQPVILQALWQREQEAVAGTTQMNCHLCKFRLAVAQSDISLHPDHHSHDHHSHDHHGHNHHGDDHHSHDHHHNHNPDHSSDSGSEPSPHLVLRDPYHLEQTYHAKIWTVP
jgi:sirohydrochlorin cobaltochelatase